MNILCRLGLHYPIKPLKHRRVAGFIRDTELCRWCHSINSYSGWYYDLSLEDYFKEEKLRELEKSCAFSMISSSVPFCKQVEIVKSLGFDVSEEEAIVAEIEEARKFADKGSGSSS